MWFASDVSPMWDIGRAFQLQPASRPHGQPVSKPDGVPGGRLCVRLAARLHILLANTNKVR